MKNKKNLMQKRTNGVGDEKGKNFIQRKKIG